MKATVLLGKRIMKRMLGFTRNNLIRVSIINVIVWCILLNSLLNILISNTNRNETTLTYKEGLLVFRGRIIQGKSRESGFMEKIDSAKITITDERRKIIETCYTNKLGVWSINLPLNKLYKVSITKPGWLSKKMNINTDIPLDQVKDHFFLINLCLFEDIPELNISVFNKPIADVYYNRLLNAFDYDRAYIKRVYETLRGQYYQYYKSHKTIDSKRK